MKSESSLPRLQEPATCAYLEPDQPSLGAHIPLLEDQSTYHSPIYVWVFHVVSFPQVSTPKPCM